MKKLMMAAAIAAAMTANAFHWIGPTPIEEEEPTITAVDTYDLTMSAKVPYVNNGIRQYASQTFKGNLYMEYSDAELASCYAVVKNTKTKCEHNVTFDVSVFNRIGKPTKYTTHAIPTVVLDGTEEVPNAESHEVLKRVTLCGSGSLSNIKMTSGSSCCGLTVSYCTKINSMSGNFTGKMDCNCPKDEAWDHTVEAVQCGATSDRSSYAAVWGTWSAKWNKKLSYVVED